MLALKLTLSFSKNLHQLHADFTLKFMEKVSMMIIQYLLWEAASVF